MNDPAVARDLLYAATAHRLGLVARRDLDRALRDWARDRARPLERVFAEWRMIDGAGRATLEAELAAALARSGGDPARALAETGAVGQEVDRLAAIDSFDTIGSEGTIRGSMVTPDPGTIRDSNAPAPSGAEPLLLTIADGVGGRGSGPDLYGTLPSTPEGAAATPPDAEATMAIAPEGGQAGKSNGAGAATQVESDVLSELHYRVLRLHARGGLGQVFLARDQGLNREVALKEILGRHADDEQSRARFLIEAEITGNLEHPGIVPVYGLGRTTEGRPYYAMRFIRGETLKEAIDRHHADTPRDAGEREIRLHQILARLVDVCNAMAYAHSRGVLHRDLKPANIMLGDFGETLVVDWGLAKFADQPESSRNGTDGLIRPPSAGSSSRTLYGSAVGTPQFMSPEQAGGRLEELGPGSDVYSLGTILYVILTGQPPFHDRELMPLLLKVRRGEFLPPRAVDRKIDPALDAICLKAMALRPADRYPTARALADDLELWMAGEPVSAYREPALARASRWARRHRTAVASVAALLVTAVVSLGIYSVLIRREQAKTLQAHARTLEEQAKTLEEQAKTLREKARTERFYGLSREVVETMLTKFAEEGLADVPQMEPLRAAMLADARRYYQQFLKERLDDPTAQLDVALATARLGDIAAFLGEDKEAEARYGEAIDQLRAMLALDPNSRDVRAGLAQALHGRGVLLKKLNGRLEDAERDLKEALDLRKDLAAKSPADADLERARIDTLYQLGALHARRSDPARADRPTARAEYDEAIAAREAVVRGPSGDLDDRRMVARYTNNLAILLNEDGRAEWPKAEAAYRHAADEQEEVHRARPRVALYRSELAKTLANLAILLERGDHLDEAEARMSRSVELVGRLAADFPRVPDYRREVVADAVTLGRSRSKLGQKAEPRAAFDEAIRIAGDLFAKHPEVADDRTALFSALIERGILLVDRQPGEPRDVERFGAAARDFERAAARSSRSSWARAANPGRTRPEDVVDLGTARYNLAAGSPRDERSGCGDPHDRRGDPPPSRGRAAGLNGEGKAPAALERLEAQGRHPPRQGAT